MDKLVLGRNHIYCMDCMDGMAQMDDKSIDLAIVDPPYGIGHSIIAGKQSGTKYGNAAAAKGNYEIKEWDVNIPDKIYFDELFRISKNQIIWGANYMSHYLEGNSGWIFWDKQTGTNDFSDGELAYTSFKRGLRKVVYAWNGMIQKHMGRDKEQRIHPTQKPVDLYKWLLQNYAKEGDLILDTHMGSGSSYIACLDMGFDYIGFEIDSDYFAAIEERVYYATRQFNLFEKTPALPVQII